MVFFSVIINDLIELNFLTNPVSILQFLVETRFLLMIILIFFFFLRIFLDPRR